MRQKTGTSLGQEIVYHLFVTKPLPKSVAYCQLAPIGKKTSAKFESMHIFHQETIWKYVQNGKYSFSASSC